ncbi:MAG: class I SAM-dependent methyltransferase [Vicinamibacterales bacterium]
MGRRRSREPDPALAHGLLVPAMFRFPRRSTLAFRCNVCGAASETRLEKLTRETRSCSTCGSWPRIRSVVHVLSSELFGASLALPDFPVRRDIKGIGLSDWSGLRALADKLDYVNTAFVGKAPQLDIREVGAEWHGTLDFIVASEVFEHVAPPVSRAFENARRMLKPGGVLVLSVPYTPTGTTIEHFPDLYRYEIFQEPDGPVLHNTTADERTQTFRQLSFHGGEGATLEMRLFSRGSLVDECARAGFSDVNIYEDDALEYGIYWPERYSRPLAARSARA